MPMSFQRLKQEVFNKFYKGDPSHDVLHIERVIALCSKIGELESANLDLLLPAALLHDIVNVPKNSHKRSQASAMAADKSKSLLTKHGYTQKEIQYIQNIIIEHSFSAGKKPSSIESAILQDADRLDGLGAIGIMRLVTCGTLMGSIYYNKDENLLDPHEMNDKKYMLDHFYQKLFKLPQLMNTNYAHEEALRRLEFMKTFLRQLSKEVSGGV